MKLVTATLFLDAAFIGRLPCFEDGKMRCYA